MVYVHKIKFYNLYFYLGEEKWGGQCSIGRRQSPIDLAEDASVAGRYPQLVFKNYEDIFKNAKIRNTGHSRKCLLLFFILFIEAETYIEANMYIILIKRR